MAPLWLSLAFFSLWPGLHTSVFFALSHFIVSLCWLLINWDRIQLRLSSKYISKTINKKDKIHPGYYHVACYHEVYITVRVQEKQSVFSVYGITRVTPECEGGKVRTSQRSLWAPANRLAQAPTVDDSLGEPRWACQPNPHTDPQGLMLIGIHQWMGTALE